MTRDAPDPRPGCPDAAELAALVDGTLPEEARAEVARHVVTCEPCRDAVGLAASLPDPEGSVAVLEARYRPFLIPVTIVTLAAAAALLFAVVLPQRWAAAERAALLQTVGAVRTIEPRLTTMAEYVAPPAVSRDGVEAAEAPLDIRIAEAELQQWADADPSAANLHALGVARLAVRDTAGAVRALEQAMARRDTPDVRNDLAAALLAEGHRLGDGVRIERARALLDDLLARHPSHAPALFNAALAAEYRGDPDAARAAWERYLAHDAESPWASEARARLEGPGVR
jgi:tetratricopeptide (TPR) repeat protein